MCEEISRTLPQIAVPDVIKINIRHERRQLSEINTAACGRTAAAL